MPRKWLCESDCDYPGYHHRMELSQAAVRGGGAIHHGGSSDLHGTSSFCYRCLGEYIEHFQLMVQNVGRSAIPPDHECLVPALVRLHGRNISRKPSLRVTAAV